LENFVEFGIGCSRLSGGEEYMLEKAEHDGANHKDHRYSQRVHCYLNIYNPL
jgi:hypothetical protein